MRTPLDILDEKVHGSAVASRPTRASFEEFLEKDARVPVGGGLHGPYTFKGREAMREIVRVVDAILRGKISDAVLAIAGGAQFGKTILELNLAAYATSQPFLNFGLFLPDDKLVDGVIDAKFRPDVIDQVPWYAQMIKVGKAVNNSGKAVDRKGAFTVTDGRRRATGMAMGLQKPPTTFSFDITAMDELDDIPTANMKFVRGRMTASDLRFQLRIGTQRVHGRGQEKAWKDGSQGVVELDGFNPETEFPGIVRCAVLGYPDANDPKLTWAGDFRRDVRPEDVVATHTPEQIYYLASPRTGEPLDRFAPKWFHRRPERIAARNWSFRISQLSIGAIGLSQIVSQFQLAVNDPDEMIVFRCDVLALPQSTTQAVTPQVIERAQTLDPFDMRMKPINGRSVFAGIDVGDKSWFFARERESERVKRAIYATPIPLQDLVKRAQSLFIALEVSCLFIDQRPDASSARSVAMALNGLNAVKRWPGVPSEPNAHLTLPGGLVWNGEKEKWENLKCAVVQFTKTRVGSGIEHGFDIFPEGGQTKFVPLIRCNRQDTIDFVVRELLTPDEGVVEYFDGLPRVVPTMLLPRKGSHPVIETVEAHFITGSEHEKKDNGETGDYVDECANHFLLANAYSALAEGEGLNSKQAPFAYQSLKMKRRDVKAARLGRRRMA